MSLLLSILKLKNIDVDTTITKIEATNNLFSGYIEVLLIIHQQHATKKEIKKTARFFSLYILFI
jgi:hypothetical protein